MSIRLGEYIVYGELFNKRKNGTHGFLALRSEPDEEDMFIRFELTGNCAPDLMGKHIRFEPAEDDGTQLVMTREEFNAINPTQHGPTGTITNQGWVRALPCTIDEFVTRARLGEPPPTEWRNHFMLEWYGPSGRVTVEMAGPTVEYCVREPDDDDEDDEGDWEPVLNLALPPNLEEGGAGPSITLIEQDESGFTVEEVHLAGEDEEAGGDPLQEMMDAETRRIDRAIAGKPEEEEEEEEGPDFMEKMSRLDYCMEHSEEKPLASFINSFEELVHPDALDDAAVEVALKTLLARLVLCGVVLDVCEHFSPRDAYRLLLEEILPQEGAYEELVGSGWIQHFSTWEYCSECEAELDEKFKDTES